MDTGEMMVRTDDVESILEWEEDTRNGEHGHYNAIMRIEDAYSDPSWIDLWIDAHGLEKLNGSVTAKDLRELGHDPSRAFNPALIKTEKKYYNKERRIDGTKLPDDAEIIPEYRLCGNDGCDNNLLYSRYVDCEKGSEEMIPNSLLCPECSDKRRKEAQTVRETRIESFTDFTDPYKKKSGGMGAGSQSYEINLDKESIKAFHDVLGVLLLPEPNMERIFGTTVPKPKDEYEYDEVWNKASNHYTHWRTIKDEIQGFIEDNVIGENCFKCGKNILLSREPPAVQVKTNGRNVILETNPMCSTCYKLHTTVSGLGK